MMFSTVRNLVRRINDVIIDSLGKVNLSHYIPPLLYFEIYINNPQEAKSL